MLRSPLLVALVLAVMGAAGCGSPASTSSTQTSTTRSTTAERSPPAVPPTTPGPALAALARLPVKGRAPMTGYSRAQFGDGWAAVDGCDTRDRILRRDLTHKTRVAGNACRVQTGHLDDPYTAAGIAFVRGGASEVDIDHVVALGDAWQKGAQQWSATRRVALANDPLNLLSVDASANRQKGDGDAATWLPANKAFRCRYVARQIAVKRRYQVWVTQAERDAMARVLATCPHQRLPRGGRVRAPVVAPHRVPATRHGRVFANCDAVRAAGLAPLHRGSAGYAANPQLDRDGDGLACE